MPKNTPQNAPKNTPKHVPKGLVYELVDLGGVRYAILPEATLRDVCRRAAVQTIAVGESGPPEGSLSEMEQMNGDELATRLAARRKSVGLTQASLAREARIRVETLNRIERGKVTPDFATIRKLLTAIKAAESKLND
jgi:DNA-binding XRE family transcriptional regulator